MNKAQANKSNNTIYFINKYLKEADMVNASNINHISGIEMAQITVKPKEAHLDRLHNYNKQKSTLEVNRIRLSC